jgi:hypothetical protein
MQAFVRGTVPTEQLLGMLALGFYFNLLKMFLSSVTK